MFCFPLILVIDFLSVLHFSSFFFSKTFISSFLFYEINHDFIYKISILLRDTLDEDIPDELPDIDEDQPKPAETAKPKKDKKPAKQEDSKPSKSTKQEAKPAKEEEVKPNRTKTKEKKKRNTVLGDFCI